MPFLTSRKKCTGSKISSHSRHVRGIQIFSLEVKCWRNYRLIPYPWSDDKQTYGILAKKMYRHITTCCTRLLETPLKHGAGYFRLTHSFITVHEQGSLYRYWSRIGLPEPVSLFLLLRPCFLRCSLWSNKNKSETVMPSHVRGRRRWVMQNNSLSILALVLDHGIINFHWFLPRKCSLIISSVKCAATD